MADVAETMTTVDGMTYPYDMTVVVPVYNAEAYLRRCVSSLDAQSAPQRSFEVVLVNDGSTDTSLTLCHELALARPNYVVIEQENRGVSAARNAGIRVARGRYIMFLDPDDMLSAPSIEALIKAFDACGDAVNLVTYPLCYHDIEAGAEHRNQRERWFGDTGVYDLTKIPQIAQTTINVAVRNDAALTPAFDEHREIYEDQVFNATVLEHTSTIGWCAEAEYRYFRMSQGTSARRDRPELTFPDVMSSFELFLSMAKRTPRFARYAYALILYNVGWRFRADKLFPVFGNEETCCLNCGRLATVLRGIPPESWRESAYLQGLWPIDRALDTEEGLEVSGHCLLPPEVGCKGGSVTVDGVERPFVLEPAFPQDENAGVWCWRFLITLPTMGTKPYDAVLRMVDESEDWPRPDLVFNVARSNGRQLNRHLREFGDWRLEVKGGHLHVGTIKNLPAWLTPMLRPIMWLHDRHRTGNYDVERVNELRRRLPKALRACRHEVAWLYDDGATAAGQGGARSRFEDDVRAADGVVRRYVVTVPTEASGGTLARHTVLRGSFEHLVCLLNAQLIVTSCADVRELLPCDEAVFDRVRDFTREGQRYELLTDGQVPLFAPAFDGVTLP